MVTDVFNVGFNRRSILINYSSFAFIKHPGKCKYFFTTKAIIENNTQVGHKNPFIFLEATLAGFLIAGLRPGRYTKSCINP